MNDNLGRRLCSQVNTNKAANGSLINPRGRLNPNFGVLRVWENTASSSYHGLQVSVYLTAFGRHLGFPKSQLEQLAQIGLLLDIGKIKLPRWLLEKQGRLTAEEYEEAKRHVAHGIAILSETPNVDPEVLLVPIA